MFYLRNRGLGGFIQNATASILLISSTYKSTIALAHCAQNSKLGKKSIYMHFKLSCGSQGDYVENAIMSVNVK